MAGNQATASGTGTLVVDDAPSPSPATQPAPAPPPGLADAQLAAILTAVEQQLTRYFSAMAARTDAVQHAGEASRNELATHIQRQLDVLASELAIAQDAAAGA
ncbi:MAG TPA: hypothetical protein PLV68_04730, partial [Ilumatobacteraceae bacterium]|nr:hypothetical protein [Ilumatobacteraceae bacterium]